MADPPCIICGGVNDAKVGWQIFCVNCAKTTWSPAVVASFIQLARQKEDYAKECEKLILELRKRIWELERNGEQNESDR